MEYIELLGIIATAILIISMAYNCKDRKSSIIMRFLNGLAAGIFVYYSIMVGAYSAILSNFLILVIDIFYIVKLIKNKV